jgi:hypothetical protein
VSSTRAGFSRLITESAVIVFSVLVAFGLDAWWDGRKARASAQDYVQSVVEELDESSGRIERSVRLARVAEDAARAWLGEAQLLPPDSLNSLLGGMVMWATADLTVPSIRALLSSGAIDLIQDRELRTWIQSFPTEVQDFEEEEQGSIAFIDGSFVPYLAAHGVSLGNSNPLGMGLQGRAPADLVTGLVNDWGFEALVVWRASKARDVIDSATKLVEVMEVGRRIIHAR